MLTPRPMQWVGLQIVCESLPRAVTLLARRELFAPERCNFEGLPDTPAVDFARAYEQAQSRLRRIMEQAPEGLIRAITGEAEALTLEELQALSRRLGVLWAERSALEEQARVQADERRNILQLLDTLASFAALDIDLSLLHTPQRLLRVRLGSVPSAQWMRLRDAAAVAGMVVAEFGRSAKQSYIVTATLAEAPESEVERVLQAAQFHPLEVPVALHAHPAQARQQLQAQLAALEARVEARVGEQHLWWARHRAELSVTAARLVEVAPYLQLGEAVRARGGLCVLCGWVPHDQLDELRQCLDTQLAAPYVLHTRAPLRAEWAKVPSDTRMPSWLTGFAALVRQYGVPGYGELDPTLWFALSFSLMFGMMFGDVGHGLVLAGAAWVLPQAWALLRVPLASAGLCSAGFGFLYGSVFGVEHWLPPLWLAPLESPRQLLAAALYGGVGFITLALLFGALALWRAGATRAALCAPQGLAGAALYLAVVVMAGAAWEQALTLTHLLALGAPLSLIVLHSWEEQAGAPLLERLGVMGIEIFETLLGWMANTLSFLRVAAFGLNHVALMLAVFAIADGLEQAGQWLAILLGNGLVLVLEGAIVAIQVLRLSFYEGFARYYTGAGRRFIPLRLGGDPTSCYC